jgi:hypothetical protein
MIFNKEKFESLLEKVEELKKSGTFDLSREEDLSIAVMNLISLEEHFFFTAEKTKNSDYLDLLEETREIRKSLLAEMIPAHEGETWCISKHLLAASMRIMEVATKLRSDGKKKEAEEMFEKAYRVYAMFWGIRLKLIDLSGVKAKDNEVIAAGKKPWTAEDIVEKLVDCCKE